MLSNGVTVLFPNNIARIPRAGVTYGKNLVPDDLMGKAHHFVSNRGPLGVPQFVAMFPDDPLRPQTKV